MSSIWHVSPSKYLQTTDLVIFDNGEQLAHAGKKRRFDEFLQTEIQSLNETIELGYCHAKQPSIAQGTRRIVTQLRKQKQRLEETRDTWVWNYMGDGSVQSSSRPGIYNLNLPRRNGERRRELQSCFSPSRLT